jgi:hypothetical protein
MPSPQVSDEKKLFESYESALDDICERHFPSDVDSCYEESADPAVCTGTNFESECNHARDLIRTLQTDEPDLLRHFKEEDSRRMSLWKKSGEVRMRKNELYVIARDAKLMVIREEDAWLQPGAEVDVLIITWAGGGRGKGYRRGKLAVRYEDAAYDDVYV